jgi:hypothetical protein
MATNHKMKEHMSEPARDPAGFDYNAPAELFPGRTVHSRGRLKYRRFETAAEALQFAIEEMPSPVLLGAFLEVEEGRFGGQEMRSLYSSAAYPLRRSRTSA